MGAGEPRGSARTVRSRDRVRILHAGSRERIIARGRSEIEAFTRDFLVETRDYRMIGEEFREVGNDKVFVAGRQTTIGRRSGVAIEGPAYWVWTFRGGKVARLLFETDERKALEAAGLAPDE